MKEQSEKISIVFENSGGEICVNKYELPIGIVEKLEFKVPVFNINGTHDVTPMSEAWENFEPESFRVFKFSSWLNDKIALFKEEEK